VRWCKFKLYCYSSYSPSTADAKTFDVIKSAPSDSHPHALRWYNHIKSFGNLKSSFGAPCAAGSPTATQAPAGNGAADDDDEVDLFASEDEEESKEAAALKEKRLADYAAKKAKSNFISISILSGIHQIHYFF